MCGDYNLRREKRYVEVDVRFTPDGKMIQLKNRPFAGKAPTTTQQAEFSIGWRFCPVCGNKLYQKIEGCSGILQVKCNRCKETLRLDLAFRCR